MYIDGDFDLFDGFEDLPDDVQNKVKSALEQGHVDDEDWKGVSLDRREEIVTSTTCLP